MIFVLLLIVLMLAYEQNCRISDDRILQKQIDRMKLYIEKMEGEYPKNGQKEIR